MLILVTGGLGYIGSHICVELISKGHNPIIVDNESNSSASVLDKIEHITGYRPKYYRIDLRDNVPLQWLFDIHPFNAIIHLAGVKSATESVTDPIKYYDNNVTGTINLVKAAEASKCRNIIFSSTACVYATSNTPLTENSTIDPINPYGKSKLAAEKILEELQKSNPNDWTITILRYFNPAGSHSSHVLSEKINSPNLFPRIMYNLRNGWSTDIYGEKWPTRDGTCIRDFIHVMDLAEGHIKALEKGIGYTVYNLGSGTGYTVKEVLTEFHKINNDITWIHAKPRSGDAGISHANPTRAQIELEWYPTRNLTDMCKDTYYSISGKQFNCL